MSKTKQQTLLLLIVAGGLLMFLAMGLPDLQLLPGQPFSLEEPQASPTPNLGPITDDASLAWLIRGGMALLLVLLPFYIVYSLSSRGGRRRLIAQIITLIALFYLAERLREMAQNGEFGDQETLLGRTSPLDQVGETAPLAVFSPDPPQWLTMGVIFVTAVLLVAMAAIIVWVVQKQFNKPASPFDQLAEEAEAALEALHTGGDFQKTIIHCYHEMSRVIQEERGITRAAAMTPREFEDRLIDRGLPGDSIRTLTRLFEQVRYGSITANPGEEDQAVACLTDIVDYCRVLEQQRA